MLVDTNLLWFVARAALQLGPRCRRETSRFSRDDPPTRTGRALAEMRS